MKFSSYQRAVAPNVPNTPAVQAARDPMAYGGEGKQYSDMAAALGQVTKVATKQQDDQDAADVMDARNKIMTSLTGQLYGENGILTTAQGENAKGATDRTTQAIKKTFDDVLKDYNGRVRYAAQGSMSENIANFQRIAASKEMEEKLATDKANYSSNLSLNAQNAAYTWNVNNALTNYIKDGKRIVTAWGVKQGWGGARTQTELQNMITQTASGAAEAAIDAEDYDRAEQILTVNRGEMNQDTYGKFMQVVNKHKQAKTYDTQAKGIFDQCWDGKNFDYSKAKQLAESVYGQNAVTTVKGGDISNKEDFFNAVAGQESGGNYDAQNGRTGAFGKYQIMPGNWPSWASEAGLSSDAPMTAENQETVAKLKLGQYYDELGPEGALVAWYAGYQNGERWRDGAADAIGEGGHYSWDAKQGNGDEPSIREYIQQALGRTGGGNKTKSAYDPEKLNKLSNMVDAMAQDAMRAQASQRKAYVDSVSRSLQGAGSYTAALSILNSSDLDMQEKNALEGQAATYYHVTRSGKPSGGSGRSAYTAGKINSAYNSLQAMSINLANGNSIGTTAYLTAQSAGNLLDDAGVLSDDQLTELRSSYKDSDFESQLTTDIENNGLSGAYKHLIQNNMDPMVATILISKADPSYLKKDYQGDQTDDDGGE